MAGKSPIDDIQSKISAFTARLQDYPGHFFTSKSLDAAAVKFTWWPAFAELAAFLEDVGRARDARGTATSVPPDIDGPELADAALYVSNWTKETMDRSRLMVAGWVAKAGSVREITRMLEQHRQYKIQALAVWMNTRFEARGEVKAGKP